MTDRSPAKLPTTIPPPLDQATNLAATPALFLATPPLNSALAQAPHQSPSWLERRTLPGEKTGRGCRGARRQED